MPRCSSRRSDRPGLPSGRSGPGAGRACIRNRPAAPPRVRKYGTRLPPLPHAAIRCVLHPDTPTGGEEAPAGRPKADARRSVGANVCPARCVACNARHRDCTVMANIIRIIVTFIQSSGCRSTSGCDGATQVSLRAELRYVATDARGNRMNRSDLIWQVSERTGLDTAEADALVKAALAALTAALARGETVRLTGFGTFVPRFRPARLARNPRTGAPIAVPASRSVSFRPGKATRDAVSRTTAA